MEPFAWLPHRFIYGSVTLRAHTPPRPKNNSRQNTFDINVIMLNGILPWYILNITWLHLQNQTFLTFQCFHMNHSVTIDCASIAIHHVLCSHIVDLVNKTKMYSLNCHARKTNGTRKLYHSIHKGHVQSRVGNAKENNVTGHVQKRAIPA